MAVVLFAACGGGSSAPIAAPTTTTAPTSPFAAYCALMARTDDVYRSATSITPDLLRAEQDRIKGTSEAHVPPELMADYVKISTPGTPNAAAYEDVVGWTQEHCGFVPTFKTP